MTNFAQLGIEVKSESAVQAADDLNKLVDSGKSAEDSARRVGAAWEKAVSGIASDTSQVVQELKLLNARQDSTAQLMAKLAQSVTDASKAFTTASVGAQTMAAAEVKVGESAEQAKSRLLALATATVDSAKSQEVMSRAYEATAGSAAAAMRAQLDQAAAQSRSARVAAAAAAEQEQLAAAERKATGATSDQARELEKLLGAIDPTIAAFARLEKQQEDLAKFRKDGLLPEDDFREYSAKLDAARSSLGGFSDGLGKTGISAKQTAAALRTVPMQVTDIVTSIAAGQPILMVALQQGGQLKDSFGGVGAAAKAMGGYVLGLVNPFTLAAAAATALGVAYYQGSKEQDEFRKALVTTGNAAGTTTTELAAMAERVGSVAGTTGGAAAALAQIAATGKIAIDRFEEIAVAAVSFEKATGKAVSETVAEFARLGEDPVKAVAELNNRYNFLTASVYEQVRAAQEMGEKEAAAAIAQEAYAKALTERAAKAKEDLGYIESAWNSIAGAAKRAWDAMLDIGREDSLEEKIADLQENISKREKNGFTVEPYKDQLAILQKQLDLRNANAKAEGDMARTQREGQAAYEGFQKSIEANFTKRQKMNKALEDEEKRIAQARAAGYSITAEEEAKALKAIRENPIYKNPKGVTAPVDLSTFNEAENALKSLVSNYQNSMRVLDASLKAGVITQQDYTLQKSALIDKERTDVEEGYKAQITALQSLADKSSTTGAQRIQIDQRIADTRQKMTQALQKLDADQQVLSLQSQERMAKETAAIEAYGQALDDNLKRTQDSMDLQLAGFGLGERTRQQFQEMLKIRQDYEKDLEKLERDHRLKRISDNEYAGQKKKLEKWLSERLKLQEQYYADEDALRGDWQNGVARAYNSYIEETKDIAGQTENLFSNALGGIEDAFVNLATKGKLSFKDLADSIIADLARIATRAYITVPLLSALGLGGSTPGGGGSILGGSGGGGGGLGLFDMASKAYGVATSGFGSAVSAGWSAGEGFLGGMQSAISGGYNYISSGLSGLFGGGAASSLAGGAGSNVGYGLGQSLVSGNIGSSTMATSSAGGLSASAPYLSAISGAIMGYQNSGVKGAAAGAAGGYLGVKGGAAAGSYFGPIGTAVGAVIGGILGSAGGSKLFGGDWVTKDTGLSLAVEDGDFLGKRYEYQKKKGGLFGKNKKRTRYSALDPEMQAALDATYAATVGSVLDLFDRLNVKLNDGVLDGLNIGAQKISTKDKTAEEIQAEIAKWFTGLGDAASQEINKVLNVGFGDELNLEYLTGFVNNLYSVNASLKMLRADTVSFDIVGGRAVEHLVALAGGLEALNAGITKFYDGFTTETQKSIDTLDGVRTQFARLNIVLPGTREAYAEMLRAIDMTAESGRAQFAAMTANAEQAAAAYTILEGRQQAFYSAFYTEAENTARAVAETTAQLKEMGITLPASRAKYRKLVEEAAKATTESGKAMYDTLMAAAQAAGTVFDALDSQAAAVAQKLNGAVDANFAAVQRSINAQKTSVNDMLATARSNASGLTSISNALGNALKALQGDSDDAVRMLRAQAKATVTSALAIARAGGSLSGFEGLEDALGVISTNDTALYSSLEDFNREQGRNANLVAELNGLNGKQLTASERTVKALEKQLAGLDKQLEYAQAQLDAFNGIDTSIKSVEAAIRALNGSLVAALVTKPSTGAGSAIENTPGNNAKVVDTLYQQLFGRTPDAGENAYWAGRLQSGNLPYNDIQNNMLQWASERDKAAAAARGYATGGFISGPGTSTSDSILARLSNGEYVMRADAVRMFGTGLLDQMNAGRLPAFAQGGPVLDIPSPNQVFGSSRADVISGGSDNGALLAKFEQLLEANKSQRFQIAKYAQQVAQLLQKWDVEGAPKERDYA